MPKQDPLLLARARALRHDMSPVEAHLWYHLRDRRCGGVKFTRGTLTCGYIPDFVARSVKLVIERDGDTHAGREAYDARRTAILEANGYTVIRFTNAEVMGNTEGVLESILIALEEAPGVGGKRKKEDPSPQPSPQGGEGEVESRPSPSPSPLWGESRGEGPSSASPLQRHPQ